MGEVPHSSYSIDLPADLWQALVAEAAAQGRSPHAWIVEVLQSHIAPRDRALPDRDASDRAINAPEARLQAGIAPPLEQLMPEIQAIARAEVTAAIADLRAEFEARLQRLATYTTPTAPAIASPRDTTSSEVAADSDPPPTVRQLQVGDIVQIRDPGSPHYREKVAILSVGLIRATVATAFGAQSFLKRDLRFVASADAANPADP